MEYEYQFPECEPVTYDIGDGTMHKAKRFGTPPCQTCPKGSPENDKDCRLSWENTRLVDLFYRLECPGYEMPEHLKNDRLFADNYSMVREILEEIDREKLADRIAYDIAVAIIRR